MNNKSSLSRTIVSLLAMSLMGTGCGSKNASFSLLPTTSNFSQSGLKKGKIDILWVVDNSGSMESSQDNLAANIKSFVKLYDDEGFDYRMAVTTTDAYKELFGAGQQQSKFRDGTDDTSHTGYFIVDRSTPNLVDTFAINALQGIYGSGDERAFQSFKQALINPMNAGFPRPDAFLAVIILSDEDDFSTDGSGSIAGQYNSSALHPVQNYVSFLDGLTGATADDREQKYSVNSITILDQTCLDKLNAEVPGRRLGLRYQDIATATGGMAGDLCGNFATELAKLSYYIKNSIREFYLDRTPNVETISVTINGKKLKRVYNATDVGWQYSASHNSVIINKSVEIAANAKVGITYDPTTIK